MRRKMLKKIKIKTYIAFMVTVMSFYIFLFSYYVSWSAGETVSIISGVLSILYGLEQDKMREVLEHGYSE